MPRSDEGGRGGSRPGAGRRPKYGSPMPRTAFTARPDQIVFYLLLSGVQKTVSAGVQIAVERLTDADPKAKDTHNKAKWIVNAAREELESEAGTSEEVTNDMILRQVLDNLDRYLADWEEQSKGNG